MPLARLVVTLAALAALSCPTAASDPTPQPRYYFILLGGQSVPFIPETAHTWAVYAKATPAPGGAVALEWFTISWLPVGRTVRIFQVKPTAGKNHTIEETLARAAKNRVRMSVWGPYEIDADRYELAMRQARFLDSGAVGYRVLDSFTGNPYVCHCVHALTYADPVLRRRVQPVIRVGEPGTSRLAGLYLRAGAFPGYPETHDWLIPALGLDRYPLTRREPGEYIRRRWLW
jgi:hypothetical protein